MAVDTVNISDAIEAYAKKTQKDEKTEEKVIEALNSGNFIVNDEKDVHNEVWHFFTEMYNKRNKKLWFFNFSYQSPFKEAFEEVDEKTDTRQCVESLLDKAKNTKNKDSILSQMKKDNILKNLANYNENFNKEYEVIKSIWTGIVVFISSGMARAVKQIMSIKRRKLEVGGKMDRLTENFQSAVVNITKEEGEYDQEKADEFEHEIKAEGDKLTEAETMEEKRKVIDTLYNKYVTQQNEKQ